MSDEPKHLTQPARSFASDHPVSILITVALVGLLAALAQYVLARFPWFQQFENHHGFWTQLLFVWMAFPIVYFFRRKRQRADLLQFRADYRAGRVMRLSLTTRCAVMLTSLGVVVTGSLVKDGALFLLFGWPVLLLFALEELNIILRPGSSVRTDPRDELLAYFKARTLQVGYAVAVISMAVLCLVGLFAPRYVVALLPVALVASLLVPSLLYRRLDRRAGADE